ncbi:MAG: hypothetical protein NW226_17920 [Microscillaceae bacterium]|nr:hypothetical protein [Microscillaceae bacterium]
MIPQIRLLFLFLLLFQTVLYGQNRLVLQHQSHIKRQKILSLDHSWTFKTPDSSFYASNILAYTDSSLSIQIHPSKDTVILHFSKIITIEKPLFKNTRWMEPFAWIALGTVLAIPLLPVAAIDEGIQGVKDWLVFEGVLFVISFPILFLGSRKIKYNLKEKWRLEAH